MAVSMVCIMICKRFSWNWIGEYLIVSQNEKIRTKTLLLYSDKKEKNSLQLKNAEISQNEERLKQELRKESQENGEMYETIQSLTQQQHDLETRLNDYDQQIKNVDDFKNEISEKNKVNTNRLLFTDDS